MRVALYYPWIYLTSGAERTLLRLTEHSRHDWTFLTNRFEPSNTFPEFSSRNIKLLKPLSVERSVTKTAESCWQLLWQQLPLDGFDALVVVCEGVGDLTLMRNHRLPAMNICLTPLRIAFDEAYRENWSKDFSFAKRAAVSIGAQAFRLVDRLAWRHYSRIFCISGEVKRRVVAGGLASSEQVEVLFPALGVTGFTEAPEYEPFFLLPGRIMWTKNLELGIRAFQEFSARRGADQTPFRLVIAGIVDAKSRPYLAKLQELAAGDSRIEFRIHPSDAELGELYRSCYCTLFTAFNEDYGIVPLEGMSYAKATIAVNRGGPRETVGHGRHGFLEEPEPDAFAARMEEMASSPELARSLGQAGRNHARGFTWTEFARTVDDALDEAVAEHAAAGGQVLSDQSNNSNHPRALSRL